MDYGSFQCKKKTKCNKIDTKDHLDRDKLLYSFVENKLEKTKCS